MISIITVCYNAEKTIRKTIESVLGQTSGEYEYIVIDGNSTDGTLSIIKEYQHRFNEKMLLISEPDKGVFDAMNKGIKISKGDLICFINSDDWLENDTVEYISNIYCGNKYEVIYGIQRFFKDGIEEKCLMYGHQFLKDHSLCHQAAFVTKACFFDFGDMFDTSYISAADYDFFARLYNSGKVQFRPVYKVLSNFSEGGISSNCRGILEGLKVRYRHGYISRRYYIYCIIREKIRNILGFTRY